LIRTHQCLTPPPTHSHSITLLTFTFYSVTHSPPLQGDCDAKMSWFLPRFEGVLRDPESAWGDWQAEYTQVGGGGVGG